MNSALARWLHLPLRGQLASLTACLLLVALALWLLLLRPPRQTQQTLRAELAALAQAQHFRASLLAAEPAEAALQSQLETLAHQRRAVLPAASLEAVLAARGSQLMQWQPEAAPRLLTLQLDWPQFPPLFAELAQTPAPFPTRFLLEAQQDRLQVSLWLENSDAP